MATLFVGNLPFDCSNEALAEHFAPYGCMSAVMQFHEDSGRPKGWALVTLSGLSDAQAATSALHDTEFQGRRMIVREDRGPTEKTKRERRPRQQREQAEAAPSNTIFVGNLAWEVDSMTLAINFPGHLSAEVQTRNDGRSRGFGLVTYESVELAQQAIAANNGLEISGRAVVCRFDRG